MGDDFSRVQNSYSSVRDASYAQFPNGQVQPWVSPHQRRYSAHSASQDVALLNRSHQVAQNAFNNTRVLQPVTPQTDYGRHFNEDGFSPLVRPGAPHQV